MEFQLVLQDIDIYSPFNRGILCGLVANFINNPLEPFFPLQNYPKQSENVIKITEEWEKSILDLFSYKKTKKLNRTQRKK